MKKLIFILAAAMTLSTASSFAHDHKGKKKCDGHCCKKEAKASVKKTSAAAKKA